jgi:hypothetical protein
MRCRPAAARARAVALRQVRAQNAITEGSSQLDGFQQSIEKSNRERK